ncbi:MAG: hypothetical protein QOK28_1260 [Actinomycetota bacterium]
MPESPGVFGNGDLEQLTGVIFDSGHFIAVGSHSYEPAVWSATDPLHWTRLARVEEGTSERPATIWSIAVSDHRYVAVGEEGDRAAVWNSNDAVTWRLGPRPPETFGTATQYSRMSAVVHFRGRWYAGGSFTAGGRDPDVAAIWTSDDGEEWTRLTPSTEQARVTGDRPTIIAMHATDKMIVAVGNNNSLADGRTTCDIWNSLDGKTWLPADVPDGALEPPGERCVLDTVSENRGHWLAAGAVGKSPQVWTSSDGTNWQPLTDALFTNDYGDTIVNGLIPAGENWIAIGNDAGPRLVSDAAVWESADTRRWVRVDPETEVFGGPDRQVMNAVTIGKGTVVAVGWDSATGEAHGSVWVQRRS